MVRAGVLRGRVYFLPKFLTCTLSESNATTRPDSLATPLHSGFSMPAPQHCDTRRLYPIWFMAHQFSLV